jgi:hypothetical protein
MNLGFILKAGFLGQEIDYSILMKYSALLEAVGY